MQFGPACQYPFGLFDRCLNPTSQIAFAQLVYAKTALCWPQKICRSVFASTKAAGSEESGEPTSQTE